MLLEGLTVPVSPLHSESIAIANLADDPAINVDEVTNEIIVTVEGEDLQEDAYPVIMAAFFAARFGWSLSQALSHITVRRDP